MDSKRCFEILELNTDAPPSEIKQAYKDIVSVWHPDRFSNNPRLRLKAEEKLKEINTAYEIFCSDQSHQKADTASSQEQSTKNNNNPGNPGISKTEAFFETGTVLVLNLFSQLSSALRQMTTEIKTEIDKDDITGE